MAEMRTILAAVDLEAGSNVVVQRAARLAAEHRAKLVLLHVVDGEALAEAAAGPYRSEDDLKGQLERQGKREIAALLEPASDVSGGAVEIRFGKPYDVITSLAGDLGTDLVVIGSGRRQTLSERVLGSTADRVVRASPVPVLIVRGAADRPYRRVAAAIDFSPPSRAAAMEAASLAPGARLELVHAVSIPLSFEQAMLRAGTSLADIERYRTSKRQRAEAELAAFAKELTAGPRAELRLIDGEPGQVLVRLATDRDVDLLALGPNGRGAVLRALLGSVTQRVLREAGCDVLIVPVAE
ncbi:universal stress protein [Hyphomicrobium sp.]|uniref:universal stress protein n=1 Tax=Hyphomicrobium sp. TaxID=82 RepID=UPI002FDD1854